MKATSLDIANDYLAIAANIEAERQTKLKD